MGEKTKKSQETDSVFKLDKNPVLKSEELDTNGFEDAIVNTIPGEKINKMIQIMILMGQRGVWHSQQAFENEVALDRLHTISYDRNKGVGSIQDVNEGREFRDDQYYDFKEVRAVLEKYFFSLGYARV